MFSSLTGCQNKEAELALYEQKDRAELEEKNQDFAIKYMEDDQLGFSRQMGMVLAPGDSDN
ncbi:MAG: hypothetical protein ISS19_00975 [Bacteroidales bacterium]|nr:hypothetical protein [Bacteroidales bacterium]